MHKAFVLIALVVVLGLVSLASAAGALLGVVDYPNKTMAVVNINENTGAVSILDLKFAQNVL